MKDLADRFAQGRSEQNAQSAPDTLKRLQQVSAGDPHGSGGSPRAWPAALRGRVDLLAAASAALAAVLVLLPLSHTDVVPLPPIAETGDEVATITVRPLADGGVMAPPDWYGLFNAYQLETSLRDISIRCNYGLDSDARVDRYLHARLMAGTQVHVFLADPGKCPKF